MNAKVMLCLLAGLLILSFASRSVAQLHPVPPNQDTIVIPGGSFQSQDTIVILGDIPNATTPQHAGVLESTINGDTTKTGARINPNRVYALQEGRWYYQIAPINVYNPTGTLTLVGIPDSAGKTKPVILIQPTNGTDVVIDNYAVNAVYGSLKFENIHYQAMELDGKIENELFYCGTANRLPQSLTIDNCLFEFSNVDLFDCSNETGAIGGWPYGAKFFITNSYFRNLFYSASWWGSRIFQCLHPIDTIWVENNTITTGGLTFWQRNELTDFAYFNHNTIVNNMKYWFQSAYHHNYFVTNNIFINQNWTGEDTDIINSGQDPDKLPMGTIDIDTNNFSQRLIVNPRYMIDGDTANIDESILDLDKMRIFVSDNINYNDPLISSGYYNNSVFIDSAIGGLPSFLWNFFRPTKIENVPGEWMNWRTKALFTVYAPPNGGFIEQNTGNENSNTVTPGIADSSVATMMGEWNQSQYGDPRFSAPPDIDHTKYIFGDYDPNTIPGLDSLGNKTENGTGITKFTDLTENFSQSAHLSTIDELPIGSLIWNDAENAAYNSAKDWQRVVEAYNYLTPPQPGIVKNQTTQTQTFALYQDYPNPFNPTTVISYQLPVSSVVTLKVYDVLGREVKTLVSERQTAGIHSITFNAGNLPSGVYFYRLQAGSFTQTRKLTLIK